MKKKGQGLSMNVIIIAAIGLVVMVVLIAIFTGRLGGFGQKLAEEQKGHTCEDNAIEGLTGLGGEWKTSCKDDDTERQIFGVTNARDLQTHAGLACCKATS